MTALIFCAFMYYVNTQIYWYTSRAAAASLHANWAEGRCQADGTLEPLIKIAEGIGYDIANLPFDKLPKDFQTANLKSTSFALQHIEETHAQGGDIESDEWLELASAKQHEYWMVQNSFCSDPLIMCPYNQLADVHKKNDRIVVTIARREFMENRKQYLHRQKCIINSWIYSLSDWSNDHLARTR
jgi:hypothetical protein